MCHLPTVPGKRQPALLGARDSSAGSGRGAMCSRPSPLVQRPRVTRSSSQPWRRHGSPRMTTWWSPSARTAASTSPCSATRPRATAGACSWTPDAPSRARPPGKAALGGQGCGGGRQAGRSPSSLSPQTAPHVLEPDTCRPNLRGQRGDGASASVTRSPRCERWHFWSLVGRVHVRQVSGCAGDVECVCVTPSSLCPWCRPGSHAHHELQGRTVP